MGKLLLLLILLLGAGLYFPQTRPTLLNLLDPLLNPVFVRQTISEMEQVVRELETLDREGRRLPEPRREFQAWMERSFQGGSLTDSWGSPYVLKVWTDSVAVVSCGPDLEIDTADDLVRAVEIRGRSDRP